MYLGLSTTTQAETERNTTKTSLLEEKPKRWVVAFAFMSGWVPRFGGLVEVGGLLCDFSFAKAPGEVGDPCVTSHLQRHQGR